MFLNHRNLIDVDENHDETEDIGTLPIEQFPEEIVSSQSLEMDAITGSTITGNALIEAVADALQSAGLDPATYDYTATADNNEDIYELDMNTSPKKEEKTDSIMITDTKGRDVEIDLPIFRYAISTMDVIDFIIPLLGEDSFNKLVGFGQDGWRIMRMQLLVFQSLIF